MSDDKKSYQDNLDSIVRMRESAGYPDIDNEWLLRSDYGFCTHCDIDIGEVERAARIEGFAEAQRRGSILLTRSFRELREEEKTHWDFKSGVISTVVILLFVALCIYLMTGD